MTKEIHIVSFSGGKDSICLLLMMLEKNMQIDDIIYCNTGVEFNEMYEHIMQVQQYIKERYNKTITILKSDKSFEYYLYQHKKTKSKYKENGYGFPRLKNNRWCTGLLKINLIKQYIGKTYKDSVIINYVGIAYDEQKRVKNECYPLIEWKITEKQALEYCYSKGFTWGGLYKKFGRLNCWCCPMQSIAELRVLYKDYPALFSKLEEWERLTYNTFSPRYTVAELRQRFNLEEEYKASQKSITSKAFYKELNELLGRTKTA